MKKGSDASLKAFHELIAMKYQIYNGLFLTLPFTQVEDIGTHLSVFTNQCREALERGETPVAIVEKFLNENAKERDSYKILFQILQFVERQVVLFDALEEAAFEEVHDMNGAGTLEHFLNNVQASLKNELLQQVITNYKVRIVLTAHPTQFYPNAILGIITDLSTAVARNELREINNLLQQMGKTSFKNRSKPTPLDEAKSLLWFLESIFYETLPNIQGRLPDSEPSLELGFWPGGDRDGNPFVTSEITRQVAQMLNSSVLNLYLKDLEHLKRRLTFDGICEQLQHIENRLSLNTKENICGTEHSSSIFYKTPEELLADLTKLRQDLLAEHQGLFAELLDNFILKVKLFGFHFACLDLRQDSRIHSEVVSEILKDKNYKTSSEQNRQAQLKKLLAEPDLKFDLSALSELALETINSLTVAQEIQANNGTAALHRYVISNTQFVSNVLEVIFLAKCANWKLEELNLDVVPLFETIQDLENAERIMQDLYRHDIYRAHLERRKKVQYIMLGFSDGTKDGGYAAANWAIYKAKRQLTKISREQGIKVIFFDGRGGPPARGGGNTHKFYRSLGRNIENEQIHLTVQGQTISSNYGTQAAAQFNLEQLFTAGLEQKVFPDEYSDLSDNDYQLLEKLAKYSLEAYLALRSHPDFLPYLQEVTPLSYYNMLNIGSRPAKRNLGKAMRFEDLRAIPFVGAWTQMKQNVPGFYGLGIGLQRLIQDGHQTELCNLYKSSLFFRTLLENAMQSLSKSYFPLTQYLADDPKFGNFWRLLYNEALLAEKMLKTVSGQKMLLQNSLAGRESIKLREKIVLPLLTVQHYAMAKARALKQSYPDDPELEVLSKLIVKSLAANVNASRNSV